MHSLCLAIGAVDANGGRVGIRHGHAPVRLAGLVYPARGRGHVVDVDHVAQVEGQHIIELEGLVHPTAAQPQPVRAHRQRVDRACSNRQGVECTSETVKNCVDMT